MSHSQILPIVTTLWAPDPEKIAHFYADILGLQRQDTHGHTPNFIVGQMSLVIMQGTPQPVKDMKRDPWPIFAFQVPNYKEIDARLIKNESPILEYNPESAPSLWFMFSDPAGNILELVDAHSFHEFPH
jgi:catechol-2,3-dioxygenase